MQKLNHGQHILLAYIANVTNGKVPLEALHLGSTLNKYVSKNCFSMSLVMGLVKLQQQGILTLMLSDTFAYCLSDKGWQYVNTFIHHNKPTPPPPSNDHKDVEHQYTKPTFDVDAADSTTTPTDIEGVEHVHKEFPLNDLKGRPELRIYDDSVETDENEVKASAISNGEHYKSVFIPQAVVGRALDPMMITFLYAQAGQHLSMAQQFALKKILRAGKGHKTVLQDCRDASVACLMHADYVELQEEIKNEV